MRKFVAYRTRILKISIVIPTLNEVHALGATLDAVNELRAPAHEIIVVDGGSKDGTIELARERSSDSPNGFLRLINSECGRGAQMHAGACAASGDVFLFLHADTIPPVDATERIAEALKDARAIGGNYAISFDGMKASARFMTGLYPRLRRLGLCYGDSAFFVRREAYEQVGGFQSLPIFEDLDLLRRLRRTGRFVHLTSMVTTSARRFERKSFALTFARWSTLQALYWAGVHPRALVRFYAPVRAARSKQPGAVKDSGKDS